MAGETATAMKVHGQSQRVEGPFDGLENITTEPTRPLLVARDRSQLRQFDAMVAEHVMGWANVQRVPRFKLEYDGGEWQDAMGIPPGRRAAGVRPEDSCGGGLFLVPHYSYDIGDAWAVLDCLTRRGYVVMLEIDGQSGPGRRYNMRCTAGEVTPDCESAPLAICLAALKLAGVMV